MSTKDTIVSARNLGKLYHLFNRPQDRLKHALFWRFGKTYGQPLWALRDVSFDCYRGETIGIIGRNGSGKSTLLQILSGILQPTEGTYSAHGRITSLLELGSGFNPEYSGRDNVLINATILGISKEEILKRFDEIVDFADIGEFMDQPVKFYSSGMFLRLAFAVQVCLTPDIFIVDEALAVGDISFQRKCYRRIDQLRERGVMTILVSHDLNAINNFCNRALLLNKGSLIAEGPPAEVTDLYQKILFGQDLRGPGEEFGDGSAEFHRIWLESPTGGEILTQVHSGEELLFCYEIKFNHDVSNPIFGLRLRNVHGVLISAINTNLLGCHSGDFCAGDTVIVKWRVENPLAPGFYFFSCGCSYEDRDQFMCRKLDVLKLQVLGSFRNSGLLDNVQNVEVIRQAK